MFSSIRELVENRIESYGSMHSSTFRGTIPAQPGRNRCHCSSFEQRAAHQRRVFALRREPVTA
jgi:hypothetical protein